MTLDQLSAFVAVAEREHVTEAAHALRLTPSAVSAAIRTLERTYGIELFHRVGRGIELTETGRVFLDEARAVLARARAAEIALSDIGDLSRGRLEVWASQTVAAYWLPPVLMRLHRRHPGLELHMQVGNTQAVVDAVLHGRAEIGFVEGAVDHGALHLRDVARDQMIVVSAPDHPLAEDRPALPVLAREASWVLREEGSGTRSEFEAALAAEGMDPRELDIVLTLPSNEAVLSAVRAGPALTAVSAAAAAPFLRAGTLAKLDVALPARTFRSLRHKERHESHAARALMEMALTPPAAGTG
ncbi:LysR family transcriptional regulator [Falsirhodobacter algicola]|uniref:LysR family transcriptional regulator n=2 Tax=Falsirhodobacter algicola TaxID=2692330 RepID=A0A8J8MU95_9RHOB|nr:LysR family transcriptional regulator [Falsirhodobacter algicola]